MIPYHNITRWLNEVAQSESLSCFVVFRCFQYWVLLCCPSSGYSAFLLLFPSERFCETWFVKFCVRAFSSVCVFVRVQAGIGFGYDNWYVTWFECYAEIMEVCKKGKTSLSKHCLLGSVLETRNRFWIQFFNFLRGRKRRGGMWNLNRLQDIFNLR